MKWQLSLLSLASLSAAVLAAPAGNPAESAIEKKRDISTEDDEAELLWVGGQTWKYGRKRDAPAPQAVQVYNVKRAAVVEDDEAELLWVGGQTWKYGK